MNEQMASELKLLEVPTSDNGTEVLWADVIDNVVRVVSVPVFAYGISRETVVSTHPRGERLRFVAALQSSPGATLRVYATSAVKASDVYTQRIFPDAKQLGLRVGPATFFDPEIVAFHVAVRTDIPAMTTYLDGLARQGIVRFWELGDPPMADEESADGEDSRGAPWELVHQLPVEGRAGHATMH